MVGADVDWITVISSQELVKTVRRCSAQNYQTQYSAIHPLLHLSQFGSSLDREIVGPTRTVIECSKIH